MAPAGRKRRGYTMEKGGGEIQRKTYPAPLATHEAVVNDGVLFWNTLNQFHSLMGTVYSIPVIGGRDLDLHVLYIEATKRGGFEKVVAEKKWREVGSVFQFAPTTTSASFVLRKHYLNILYHYEQVHLFRNQGPIFGAKRKAFLRNGGRSLSKSLKKSMMGEGSSSAPHPKPAEEPVTFTATGTIEGKFESGYMVSVKIGSEVLSGVLYHPQPLATGAHALASGSVSVGSQDATGTALVPFTPGRSRHYGGRGGRKLRGRGSRRLEDLGYPKSNRSGYNFFFAELHSKLKSMYPMREREFTKIIGHSWTNLSAEEKAVYQILGLQDKERYKREVKEYNEKKKLDLDLAPEVQKATEGVQREEEVEAIAAEE